MAKRKRYSIEFQANAVKMILNKGHSVAEASRKLNLDYSVLWRWKKKYEKIFEPAMASQRSEENLYQSISELNSKLEKVTEERNILMKALSHFIAKQD